MHERIEIIGNLGGDPEMRYTPTGAAVTTFSVATSHSYQKNEEWHTETKWWRVTTWNKLAERCAERLAKGSRVFVEGRISVDKETGHPRVFQRQDGTWDASLELTASRVLFLTKNEKESGQTPYDEEGDE